MLEHLSLVIHIPLVRIPPAHPRHTAQPGLIVLVPELTPRASIEAAPSPDVTAILCPSRDLIPLQCLQGRILREKRGREDKVTRVRAVHVRYHEGRGDGLQMAGLLVLPVAYEDAFAL